MDRRECSMKVFHVIAYRLHVLLVARFHTLAYKTQFHVDLVECFVDGFVLRLVLADA